MESPLEMSGRPDFVAKDSSKRVSALHARENLLNVDSCPGAPPAWFGSRSDARQCTVERGSRRGCRVNDRFAKGGEGEIGIWASVLIRCTSDFFVNLLIMAAILHLRGGFFRALIDLPERSEDFQFSKDGPQKSSRSNSPRSARRTAATPEKKMLAFSLADGQGTAESHSETLQTKVIY